MITDAFNAGVDRSGTSIGSPTAFFPGAAAAPNAPDLDHEVRLLARKVQAGARFVLTQPVYSVEPLAALREAYEKVTDEAFTIPVLAGVLPLVSSRHAGFLHNEVPGIEIPEPARDRMRRAGDDAEAAWEEGRSMAIELVAALRDADVAGVYVMPQFGRYDRAAEVVEAARGPATM
jgi:5,10-methylenetetrahydrofolate reductase